MDIQNLKIIYTWRWQLKKMTFFHRVAILSIIIAIIPASTVISVFVQAQNLNLTDENWVSLNQPSTYQSVAAIQIYKGTVYICGNFKNLGADHANYLAKLENGFWKPIDNSELNSNSLPTSVNAIAFDSSGNLYIGGSFNAIGNVRARNIARWNGTSWDSLNNSISESINTIVCKNDTIFAAGDVHIASGDFQNDLDYYINVYAFIKNSWKLYTSTSLGQWDTHAIEPCPYTGYKITKIDFDRKGKLWIAGNYSGLEAFTLEDSIYSYYLGWYQSGKYYEGTPYFAENIRKQRYDGTATGNAVTILNDHVSKLYAYPKYAMAVDKKGVVYYGGNFSRYLSNTVKVNNIEIWDGKNLYPIGSGVNGKVFCLAIDQNDSLLYVGGNFYQAGNAISPMIAAVDLKKQTTGTESVRKITQKMPQCFIKGEHLSINGFLPGDNVEIYNHRGQLIVRSPCSSVINIPKTSMQQLILCIKRNNMLLFSTGIILP
jgi:hypothetical protein